MAIYAVKGSLTYEYSEGVLTIAKVAPRNWVSLKSSRVKFQKAVEQREVLEQFWPEEIDDRPN